MTLKQQLLKIWYLFRYFRSYSQDGEDRILFSLIEHYGKDYKGFYIDIGAHHPIRFSNTQIFYRKGWAGINIDAQPGSMRLFNWLRSRDINLEMGVANIESTLTFYIFNDKALNTFSKELAAEWSKNYKIIQEIKVPVKPLASILSQYIKTGQKIDFMSVDVEGLDEEVLRSNDWKKFKPDFLIVEDLGCDIENLQNNSLYSYLSNQGYTLKGKTKRSLILALR
jgi:FkbM family methyltransferase